MKIILSKKEYRALDEIRGAPEDVHYMVMCSKEEQGRMVLEGNESTFEELLGLISEEISERLCPAKNISPLLGICKKINPSSLDWVGM